MIRDRKYLDALRAQPCLICGLTPSEPAHIGTAGKAVKSPDNEAVPLCHTHHRQAHAEGEMTFFRHRAANWLLRDALRSWARERYQEWRSKNDR